MSVRLEFINLIIPISKIDEVYPGGFAAFKEERKRSFKKGPYWHDDYLFRDGAMNPMDMDDKVKAWEKRGLAGIAESDGEQVWKDICVVDFFNGPTLPCDWIEWDGETSVRMAGI